MNRRFLDVNVRHDAHGATTICLHIFTYRFKQGMPRNLRELADRGEYFDPSWMRITDLFWRKIVSKDTVELNTQLDAVSRPFLESLSENSFFYNRPEMGMEPEKVNFKRHCSYLTDRNYPLGAFMDFTFHVQWAETIVWETTWSRQFTLDDQGKYVEGGN